MAASCCCALRKSSVYFSRPPFEDRDGDGRAAGILQRAERTEIAKILELRRLHPDATGQRDLREEIRLGGPRYRQWPRAIAPPPGGCRGGAGPGPTAGPQVPPVGRAARVARGTAWRTSAPGVSPNRRAMAFIVVAAVASSCGICEAVVATWAAALATSSPVVSPPCCRSCVKAQAALVAGQRVAGNLQVALLAPQLQVVPRHFRQHGHHRVAPAFGRGMRWRHQPTPPAAAPGPRNRSPRSNRTQSGRD